MDHCVRILCAPLSVRYRSAVSSLTAQTTEKRPCRAVMLIAVFSCAHGDDHIRVLNSAAAETPRPCFGTPSSRRLKSCRSPTRTRLRNGCDAFCHACNLSTVYSRYRSRAPVPTVIQACRLAFVQSLISLRRSPTDEASHGGSSTLRPFSNACAVLHTLQRDRYVSHAAWTARGTCALHVARPADWPLCGARRRPAATGLGQGCDRLRQGSWHVAGLFAWQRLFAMQQHVHR